MNLAKPKILLLLGAGSSVECGMPSVGVLDEHLRGSAVAEANLTRQPNYFAHAWELLERQRKIGFTGEQRAPDYERALAEILALMQWARPLGTGSGLRWLVTDGALPDFMADINHDAFAPYVDVKMFLTRRMRDLAKYVRARSAHLDVSSTNVVRWRGFLEKLRSEFAVALYTLNYDNVAVTCWPGAFTGFDAESGVFDACAFHRRQWNGLMHLHGSVHFSLRDLSSDELIWVKHLKRKEEFLDTDEGRSGVQKGDGRETLRTTLVAGGFKLDQLLAEPFNSYQAALIQDVYEADAILIGGYGFGDAHVNRALVNALVRRRRAKPRILVVDYADDACYPIASRNELWSNYLGHFLDAPREMFKGADGVSYPNVGALKANATCELSPHHPVAIWYGGFLAAADEAERLTQWLLRGDNRFLVGGSAV